MKHFAAEPGGDNRYPVNATRIFAVKSALETAYQRYRCTLMFLTSMTDFGLRCIFVKSFHTLESAQLNMSNKIPEGWKAASSSASAVTELECLFEVTAAELQFEDDESKKYIIEDSQSQQTAATAAKIQHCIHRAINFSLATPWSETFGPMTVDNVWGTRFWEGFADVVMTKYCQTWHLDFADFRPGMFTAPVPFAKRICWEQELTDQNSKKANQFPCFFTCSRQYPGS